MKKNYAKQVRKLQKDFDNHCAEFFFHNSKLLEELVPKEFVQFDEGIITAQELMDAVCIRVSAEEILLSNPNVSDGLKSHIKGNR